ncbi:hypothetical protein CSA56_14830 [candidate division KSB3 bacterium]|uniref:DUF72 domain-containing protein n=1 Tax=candidate division KSB3 bacterium TaxID=2044937 RepID=A0A2G6KA61_9BACT|nr:MAG: hypothetical protein CSA56_14830 [candidate division KSB3 bacterium]
MIVVGTSGFSYADWVGPFYPQSLAKQDFLSYYSQHFQVCELNFSYYRVPTAQTLERMAQKSGEQVEFVVKANKMMTHERSSDSQSVFTHFVEALTPLKERQLLGAVLAQFPYSFHNTPKNRDYVKRVRELLGTIPLVIEFRHHKWMKEATFALLKELGCGFCCVDEPQLPGLLPPVAVATSDIGYVRFHGRNRETWWQHTDPAERYDYCYTETELQKWVPKIQRLEKHTQKVYVFTNNHPNGQAVQNAQDLQALFQGS